MFYNNFILPDKKALITLRAGLQAEHGTQISTSCKPELITKQSSWNRKCVAKKYLQHIITYCLLIITYFTVIRLPTRSKTYIQP